MTPQSREARAACRRIRREWEAAGRPPCPVCDSPIEAGEKYQADQRWRAVVHRLCGTASVGRPAAALGDCPERKLFGGCPIPFLRGREAFCVCPLLGAANMVVLARRLGRSLAPIPTTRPGVFGPVASPACVRAAREVGLGRFYEGVPLRESVFYGAGRRGMIYADGVTEPDVWDSPTSWYEPPDWVTIDIDRSIREGRVVAAPRDKQMPPPEDEEAMRLGLSDWLTWPGEESDN